MQHKIHITRHVQTQPKYISSMRAYTPGGRKLLEGRFTMTRLSEMRKQRCAHSYPISLELMAWTKRRMAYGEGGGGGGV